MAAANQGDIYLVTINGLIHGQRTMNTFHYRLANVVPGVTVQDVYAALSTRFRDPTGLIQLFKNACPSTWTFTEAWYQRVYNQRIVKLAESLNSGPGTQPASTVTNVTGVITRYGENASRHNRSSLMVPITPANVASGSITFAQAALLTGIAQECLAQITVLIDQALLIPVIWHKSTANPPVNTLIDLYGVTVQTTARVMNRRTVGRGI